LAALSGQPPGPGGSRRKARGVDGESACQATMVPGHYAANVTAFCVAVDYPLSALKCRITFGQLIQGGALFAMRHSPHRLISGRNRVPYQGPLHRCEGTGAPRGWDPSTGRRIAAMRLTDHTSTLETVHPFCPHCGRFYLLLRTAPSGTTPVSR
jgi:hypothetical protein